ncbi:lysophospholipid acyltransferase family protein [Clostridium sp. HV4-5-A1G]|jgi:1-acyl-sn-glycerol-3-phosphate acyltransferase|uniref:lysophospholipid acyltransferase family protein n=1 Tax=Clostridium sp. HV4-5-A1G TaxID=2004595 RepID=UPI0012397C98|nr:lysophospholipid acyltransferase family protein [Clostridium sp. HV4-5-A1G]KAA8667364.1 1-acyl-sn-glycerol-3-phosphate acyltransferase [Clostridium sp. HV4-5-A1G]
MRTVFLYLYFTFYVFYTFYLEVRIKSVYKNFPRKEADERISKIVSRWAKNILDRIGVKVDVIGNEKLTERNYLFVSNHQGNFDPFIILAYIHKPMGFIAKNELLKIPIIREGMKKIHCVFMNRKNIRESAKAIDEGIDNLKKGYSMVIFPEGTISKCHEMLEFKRGSFKLAIRSGIPIVPVAIDGSHKIFEDNRGKKFVPARVRMIIDKPIDVKFLSANQKRNLPLMVKSIIGENLDRG